MTLPHDNISSVANLFAKITGLWNSIFITEVPNAIFFVFAATKVSVSSGSSIVCILTGKLPSNVPLNAVLGFNGQRILSETQRESKPSCSDLFAISSTFRLVAEAPSCGKLIPTFTPN
jgi:hypothetical protein